LLWPRVFFAFGLSAGKFSALYGNDTPVVETWSAYPACALVNKKERLVKVKIADDMVIGQPLPTCLAHRC